MTIVRRVSDLLNEGFPREKLVKEFVRINAEAWPPPVPERYLWNKEKVDEQFERCPSLLFCAFQNDKVVGTLSIIHLTEEEALRTESWEKTSGNGTLATHQPHGDCAFGLDLSVTPGAVAGDQLIEMGILSAVVLANKKGVFLGSRAPGYLKYCKKKGPISIEEYIGFGGGRNHDPEIRLYQSEGFRIIRVVPGYMEDPDSLDYGILMFWENPYYRYTRFLGPIMKLVSWTAHRWFLR